MPDEKLQPDQKAVEAWDKLEKNAPSKQALPPAAGGLNWAWGFIILLGLLIVIGLLAQWLTS